MKELPLGWAEVELGHVASLIRGVSFPRSARRATSATGHVACLRTTNVQSSVTWDDLWFIPTEFVKNSQQYLQPGDVLISMANSLELVGKVAQIRSDESLPAVPGAFIAAIRTLEAASIDPAFLFYQLQLRSVRESIRQTASTTTNISNISAPAVLATGLVIAPFSEQRRIVAEIEEHLSRIDAACVGLGTVCVKVASYVAHMFERAVSEAPHTEFRRVLAAPLANGRSVPTASSGFPVLRLTSIRNARVDLSEFKIGAWDARQAEPFLVTEGDLLIVRGNGSLRLVGRAGLVQDVSSPVAFPDTLIRAKLDSGVALPAYVARAWHTHVVRSQIEAAARTSAGIYKINQTDIENLRIPLPPLPVQEHLTSSADAVEGPAAQAHAAIERSIHMAARLRQAILKKAFEGRLVPQDPNDEPASVLLERIRTARAQAPARRAPPKREVRA